MPYQLKEINESIRTDPKGYLEACDAAYQSRISSAVDRILERMKESPIVLLSGPSGSGKTTTALKLEQELERRGVNTHTISMDNYYKTLNRKTAPRTPEGTSTTSPRCCWTWTCWTRPSPGCPGASGWWCPSTSLPARCATTAGAPS